MAGKLYLCATPIGNLEDITLRVLRVLKEVDLIAAEDTRNSIRLLNHFGIHTPMTSYHEHNKIEKAHRLVEKMQNGQDIALITDAGTPGISDPGEDLVRICYEAGIEVTALPGAAACVTALTMSGLKTRRFAFEAFLPRDKKEREETLKEMERETRTLVLYEAPHHLLKTLQELTKKFEEIQRTTLGDAVLYYSGHPAKGEFVLVIEGKSRKVIREEEEKSWEKIPIEEHMALYEGKGETRKEAMKRVAKDRGISKREVYQRLL